MSPSPVCDSRACVWACVRAWACVCFGFLFVWYLVFDSYWCWYDMIYFDNVMSIEHHQLKGCTLAYHLLEASSANESSRHERHARARKWNVRVLPSHSRSPSLFERIKYKYRLHMYRRKQDTYILLIFFFKKKIFVKSRLHVHARLFLCFCVFGFGFDMCTVPVLAISCIFWREPLTAQPSRCWLGQGSAGALAAHLGCVFPPRQS